MSKLNLKSITQEFFDFKNFGLQQQKSHSYCERTILDSTTSELSHVPSKEFSLQSILRPHFGKQDLNRQAVGPHPDFAYLKDSGDTEHHSIVTLFIDIKGSTRLNLLLDIQKAFYVKNRILQAAIEVVRALDGHPHRLMGDALMAFFGGKNISKEDAIADALNAAAMLQKLMTEYVFPELDKHLPGRSNMAVRIGFDFGDDQQVLWGSYGFGDASEVTAQGLHVDFASKLQSRAGANNAMIGQNLYQFVDFPEQYLDIKKTSDQPCKILKPNITDPHGQPINYNMRLLKMVDYQRLLPIPTETKANWLNRSRVTSCAGINYHCQVEENGNWDKYPSVSRFLSKDLQLRFTVKVNNDLINKNNGLEIIFTKQNHGKEAGLETAPLQTSRTLFPEKGGRNNISQIRQADHEEATLYRGLHTMNVRVLSITNKTCIFEDWIGVYVI